jgi:hypothetical protein
MRGSAAGQHQHADTDRQQQADARLLDVDKRGQHQRERDDGPRPGDAACEVAEQFSCQPDREQGGHRQRCLAVGGEEVARHEAGVERHRQQQSNGAGPPGGRAICYRCGALAVRRGYGVLAGRRACGGVTSRRACGAHLIRCGFGAHLIRHACGAHLFRCGRRPQLIRGAYGALLVCPDCGGLAIVAVDACLPSTTARVLSCRGQCARVVVLAATTRANNRPAAQSSAMLRKLMALSAKLPDARDAM